MKILHTADWHLGQSFFDYDRRWEHERFLEWLKGCLKDEKIDVMLIAGDVFDTPNPSADAQKMYYRFLRDVAAENPELQVIIIAGNHDSAARLESPSVLLELINVTVVGGVRRNGAGEVTDLERMVAPLKKGGCCLAVPYLRQGEYPAADSYVDGVRLMYQAVYAEGVRRYGHPVIAMGHLQMSGAKMSEFDRSERMVIGGMEGISADLFDEGIDYVALGHLHRHQRVAGREHVRYAGAPLPMSFAEEHYHQGVTVVELNEGSPADIKRLEFDAPVRLLRIPEQPLPLEQVLELLAALPDGEVTQTSPYLEVKIRITEPEPTLRQKIQTALEGKSVRLARMSASVPTADKESAGALTYEELKTIQPMEMACDIYAKRYRGEPMPDRMKNMLQQVIEEVQE